MRESLIYWQRNRNVINFYSLKVLPIILQHYDNVIIIIIIMLSIRYVEQIIVPREGSKRRMLTVYVQALHSAFEFLTVFNIFDPTLET